MREYFRPYSLAITLDSVTASGVTLVDTAGSALKCNYISVECSSGGTDDFFRVMIEPPNLTTPVANTTGAAASLGLDTSAAVCGYADQNDGRVVEFLLSDADRANHITIQQSSTAKGNYFITYGQVQTGNPLRDGERPIGS
jgi:hypothetical protein